MSILETRKFAPPKTNIKFYITESIIPLGLVPPNQLVRNWHQKLRTVPLNNIKKIPCQYLTPEKIAPPKIHIKYKLRNRALWDSSNKINPVKTGPKSCGLTRRIICRNIHINPGKSLHQTLIKYKLQIEPFGTVPTKSIRSKLVPKATYRPSE